MERLRIKINGIADVTRFVQAAKEVEGDIILEKGRFCVDGKSILGVLSLDMSSGVIIEYPKEALEFASFLQEFIF